MNGIRATRGRFTQWKDLYFPTSCGSYEIDFRPIKLNNLVTSESKIIRTIENSLSNEEEILDNEFSETNNNERYSDHRTGRALDDNQNRFGNNNQFNSFNNNFNQNQFGSAGNPLGKQVSGGAYDPNLYDKPFRKDSSGI